MFVCRSIFPYGLKNSNRCAIIHRTVLIAMRMAAYYAGTGLTSSLVSILPNLYEKLNVRDKTIHTADRTQYSP